MKRIIAVVLICVTLAGCTGYNQDTYVPTGAGLYWEEGETHPTVEQQKPEDQKVTLTYYPDITMNPYQCSDFTNRALFGLLYQSLFTVDRNYHIEPQLCTQYRVSAEMDVYTFYIAQATFSDGAPLTAQDVAASLLEAKESPIYKGRMNHVTEITVTDDGAVQIRLDTPYEEFPLLLDIPILKQSELKSDYPLGTGPYTLETTTGGKCLYRRMDWWCQAETPVTAVSIALIEAESPAQIRNAFELEGSDLDLVCADPGSDRYVDFRCDYELWDAENGILLYLGCNMVSQVFSVPEVRSALTFAVDRETLVDTYYQGFARPTTLPASPQFPYYSTKLAENYNFDAEKFTQAVNDAGVQGMPVMFLVNKDDTKRLRVARDIGKMLANCGLNIQMKEQSGEQYKKTLENRDYDLYLGQTKLSANMDLSPFFASGGALSYGSINDVSMYALCLQALANHGNYYSLHKEVADDGRICPVLLRSYAVYTTRGLLPDLAPARDNIFYYSLGRTMEDALIKE